MFNMFLAQFSITSIVISIEVYLYRMSIFIKNILAIFILLELESQSWKIVGPPWIFFLFHFITFLT